MDLTATLTAIFASEQYHIISTAITQISTIIASSAMLTALLPKELKTTVKFVDDLFKLIRNLLDWLAMNYGNATNAPPDSKKK